MYNQLNIEKTPSKLMRISLWIAQFLAFLVFCFAGYTKLTTPIAQLSQMMPWTGEYPENFVRFIAIVDLLGGIGILLPSLTRIMPRLTVIAALGCTILQILAICFHASRSEFMVLPLNFVLISLAIFVFWGRSKKAVISPRK